MITVNVKLFASLQKQYPGHPLGRPMPVQLPDLSTLDHLIHHLNLTDAKIILVNGIAQTDGNHLLRDNDELAIFPLLAGG